MNFTELPLEIIILVIQTLDTPSVYNMYNTCKYIRYVVTLPGVVKLCKLSMNTLAAVNTFKTSFFHDVALHLQELNMCGAPDVRKTILLAGMKKLKNLQTLDISYTNLNLEDFLAIYKVCPKIVNVSLNFMVDRKGITRLGDESIKGCQKAFKNCKNIHFVGSATNLIYTKLSLLLLQDADLDTLKFSVAESDRLHTIYVPEVAQEVGMAQFKKFFLYFLDWKTVYAFFGSFFMLPVLAMVELSTIEVIIIIKQNFKNYTIHSTPMFREYFQDTFNVETEKLENAEYRDAIIGNAAIMIWNKEYQTFDDEFFSELTQTLKPYFPWECLHDDDCPVPKEFDWFYITPTVPDGELEKRYKAGPKNKRRAPPEVALNYDKIFESKERLQLSVICDEFIPNPVTLSCESNYLGKLTFLSLTGSVRYTADFFKVLFRCCVNLVTLNLEAPAISPCVLPISNNIFNSPKLKNFRLTDRTIDFRMLFTSLAECKTLESVHLVEESTAETVDITDPGIIIVQCPNLYNLYIEAPMTEKNRIQKERMMHKAKMKYHKYHVNTRIHVKADFNRLFYSYDQYISVFNLNPIKQINV